MKELSEVPAGFIFKMNGVAYIKTKREDKRGIICRYLGKHIFIHLPKTSKVYAYDENL